MEINPPKTNFMSRPDRRVTHDPGPNTELGKINKELLFAADERRRSHVVSQMRSFSSKFCWFLIGWEVLQVVDLTSSLVYRGMPRGDLRSEVRGHMTSPSRRVDDSVNSRPL